MHSLLCTYYFKPNIDAPYAYIRQARVTEDYDADATYTQRDKKAEVSKRRSSFLAKYF